MTRVFLFIEVVTAVLVALVCSIMYLNEYPAEGKPETLVFCGTASGILFLMSLITGQGESKPVQSVDDFFQEAVRHGDLPLSIALAVTTLGVVLMTEPPLLLRFAHLATAFASSLWILIYVGLSFKIQASERRQVDPVFGYRLTDEAKELMRRPWLS